MRGYHLASTTSVMPVAGTPDSPRASWNPPPPLWEFSRPLFLDALGPIQQESSVLQVGNGCFKNLQPYFQNGRRQHQADHLLAI